MNRDYKPKNYNSVSPYFIVAGAEKLIDLVSFIFDAKVLRRFDMPDGTIMHIEVQIDDSIIMLGEASEQFPANTLLTHIYVPNVDAVFAKAIEAGCEVIGHPKTQAGDTDKRGTFKDFAGNMWSVASAID